MPRFRDLGRLAALRARQAGKRLGGFVRRDRPADIVAYRGYGSVARAYLHGRALAQPLYTKPEAEDPLWRNLVNTYRRARSSPIADAEVCARFGPASRTVTADDEGFFGCWLELSARAVRPGGWHPATLEHLSPSDIGEGVRTGAEVLIPPRDARFGIISDLDDTVIQSHVTSFLRAARAIMLENALTRLPFAGVAEFYSALVHGVEGDANNPVFYVSSSPWNLYDVIEDFLAVQGIPQGPLLLRDWDIGPRALGATRHHHNKVEAVRDILTTYPALPFILIGDSGQKDPEIYHEVVHDYPDRVLAIYIRDVVRKPGRESAIAALADEVERAGSVLQLVPDTSAAARDAAERGWISDAAVDDVASEVAADAGRVRGKIGVSD